MILKKEYIKNINEGQDLYADFVVLANEKGLIVEDMGDYYEMIAPPVVELDYAQKRLNEYPSIGEQLDMQYWDKINGTNHWQEKIAEIKEKYQKV